MKLSFIISMPMFLDSMLTVVEGNKCSGGLDVLATEGKEIYIPCIKFNSSCVVRWERMQPKPMAMISFGNRIFKPFSSQYMLHNTNEWYNLTLLDPPKETWMFVYVCHVCEKCFIAKAIIKHTGKPGQRNTIHANGAAIKTTDILLGILGMFVAFTKH